MPKLRVDDFDMHYVEAGAGPPLLLIHGLGGSHLDWEHQIAHFARQYRVIAPDLRGFGASGAGRRLYSIRRLARDVTALLAQLGVERFALVGHSMGGAVAQQLALDTEGRVQKLVVANSMPMFRPQTLRHWMEFSYRWAVMGLLGPARLARIGAWRMYPGDAHAAEREKSIARGARNTRYAYLAALAALGRWSVMLRLGQLRMPVLVIASEHDYFTREETLRFAHALPRGRLRIIAGAHHGLPAEMPEVFNALVTRFLRAPHTVRDQAPRHAAAGGETPAHAAAAVLAETGGEP
ncbi:alpha/beta fold hydrolase [Solimonas soli]|uniref:alpha/beta fold hydrolase n=1 Tax=Solimonas soli TaxID=413479 RepID=UPI0004B6734D|nr:alpha/beta hydrolase [Solimonas soli]